MSSLARYHRWQCCGQYTPWAPLRNESLQRGFTGARYSGRACGEVVLSSLQLYKRRLTLLQFMVNGETFTSSEAAGSGSEHSMAWPFRVLISKPHGEH